MATVTPKQIYQALLAKGASTTQAIGIMANGIAESGLNPEAVGDQGTSFGVWQQHGAQYSTLVTGNPSEDLAAQVNTLAANGAFASASGSTPAQAAGNFAANYERCTTCQPGQASYNQRVANAATVAGWVSSGSWPTSAGSATAAAASSGGSSSSLANSSDPTCAFGISGGLPGVSSVPVVGSLLSKATSVDLCFVKKTTLRHIVGGLLIAGGGIVVMGGAIILAASSFNHTGAGRAVERTAEVIPAAGIVARGARATEQHTARRDQAAAEQRAQIRREDTQARRAAGSRASQDRARRGLAPRQPRPAPQQRPPREQHH